MHCIHFVLTPHDIPAVNRSADTRQLRAVRNKDRDAALRASAEDTLSAILALYV